MWKFKKYHYCEKWKNSLLPKLNKTKSKFRKSIFRKSSFGGQTKIFFGLCLENFLKISTIIVKSFTLYYAYFLLCYEY